MLSNRYNEPQQSNQGEKSKVQPVLIIAGILMGLLVLLNVVIYFRGEGKITKLNEDQATAMAALQKETAAANARFDSLSSLFPARDAQIEELKLQLEEKNQELQKYIAAGGNLAAARSEIASLRETNESLKSQLADERNKNASSEARIAELTNELTRISDELGQTQRRLKEYEDKATSTPAPDPGPGPGPGSDPKPNNVEKALSISGVIVKANEISKKDPTKKRETKSAGKTGELQICWVVEPTDGIGPSTQDFHIQIIDPTQTTIGTSTAPDKSSGNSYKYTLEESMSYDGANAQVCSYFKSGEFSKGTYEVNIWNKGMKVGTGSVTLKK